MNSHAVRFCKPKGSLRICLEHRLDYAVYKVYYRLQEVGIAVRVPFNN